MVDQKQQEEAERRRKEEEQRRQQTQQAQQQQPQQQQPQSGSFPRARPEDRYLGRYQNVGLGDHHPDHGSLDVDEHAEAVVGWQDEVGEPSNIRQAEEVFEREQRERYRAYGLGPKPEPEPGPDENALTEATREEMKAGRENVGRYEKLKTPEIGVIEGELVEQIQEKRRENEERKKIWGDRA